MQQSSHDQAQQCFCCLTQISPPEPQTTEGDLQGPAEASAAAPSQSDCFTQRNSLFHQEVLQVTLARLPQVVTLTLPVFLSLSALNPDGL